MTVFLGTLAVIAIFVVWLFTPRKPLPKLLDSPDALARSLKYLRDRGLEGAELWIQAKTDIRVLVIVTKHIVASHSIELRGAVTDEAMLDGGYEAVKASLARRGIAYGEGDLNGRRSIVLRVHGSLYELEVFVQTVMDLGFGKTVRSDCEAYFKNVLIWNMPSVTGVGGTK